MASTEGSGERIGELIRKRRDQLGLSEEEVAQRLIVASGRDTVTRTDVWRWETEYEGRTPGPQWLPHLAGVLSLPEDNLRRARAASKAARRFKLITPPSPSEVLASLLPSDTQLAPAGTTTGRTIGSGDAEALLQRVHGLRLADDVLAGGDLVETAVREFRAAVALHNNTCHSEAVGRQLLVAIGELAQLAGWVATDSGGKVDPAPLFRVGVEAARQASDGPLAAHLLGSWGYWEANRGNVSYGLDLVRAAEAAAASGPVVRARSLTAARLAWTSALAGDDRNALSSIATAMDQVDAADEDGPALEEPRRWLYWVNRDEQEVMQARVYTLLHRPLRAVPLLRKVLSEYDASHAREYALYASWLAVALLDANEPEEAAAAAQRMFEVLAGIPSARAADRSQAVLRRLHQHRGVAEVAEVLASWS